MKLNRKTLITVLAVVGVIILGAASVFVIPKIVSLLPIAPTAPGVSEAAKWQTADPECKVGFSVAGTDQATAEAVLCNEGFRESFAASQLNQTNWGFLGEFAIASGSGQLTAAAIVGNEKKQIPFSVIGMSGYLADLSTKKWFEGDVETWVNIVEASGRVVKKVETGSMIVALSLFKDENNHVDIRYVRKAGVVSADVWMRKGGVDQFLSERAMAAEVKPVFKLIREGGRFKAYIDEGAGFSQLTTDDNFILDDRMQVLVYVNAEERGAKARVGDFFVGCIGGVLSDPPGVTPVPTNTPIPTNTPVPTSTPTPVPTNTPNPTPTPPTVAGGIATPTPTGSSTGGGAGLAEGTGGAETAGGAGGTGGSGGTVVTPTEAELPSAGIGLPTLGALGGGVIMILLGILLAL